MNPAPPVIPNQQEFYSNPGLSSLPETILNILPLEMRELFAPLGDRFNFPQDEYAEIPRQYHCDECMEEYIRKIYADYQILHSCDLIGEESNLTCCICCDIMYDEAEDEADRDYIMLSKCLHLFHMDCLERMIVHGLDNKKIIKCPLCRTLIGDLDY